MKHDKKKTWGTFLEKNFSNVNGLENGPKTNLCNQSEHNVHFVHNDMAWPINLNQHSFMYNYINYFFHKCNFNMVIMASVVSLHSYPSQGKSCLNIYLSICMNKSLESFSTHAKCAHTTLKNVGLDLVMIT